MKGNKESICRFGMVKYRASALLLCLLWICIDLLAQTSPDKVTVEGVVYDQSGFPLIGVNIVEKENSSSGIITDIDGHFSMSVSRNATLVFSYVGFEKKELQLAGLKSFTNLKIELEDDTQKLTEVVVVGYGVQKKASIVGAITQAKGDDLLKVGGTTNVSSALTGMLPGVTAIQSSGEPGSDQAQIVIRGKSTWGSTEPLVLVDGIERSFNDIDPNEIESLSVLKDASATAVYGVKGANGVILVTTKRGKEGKIKINFSSNFGLKEPINNYEVLDRLTAMDLASEAHANEGRWDKIYSETYKDNWRNNTDPYFYPELNWKDLLYKKVAFSQQYNLNMSGGTSFVKYFASIGYTKDGDVFKTEKQPEYDPTFKYERYNYRTNLDMDVTKYTKISVNLAGDIATRNRPLSYMGRDPFGSSSATNNSDLFSYMYLMPNYVYPLRYENGILGTTSIGRWWNPIYSLNYQGSATQKTSRLFSDVTLKQNLDFITKGLSVQAKVSYNTTFAYNRLIQKDVACMYWEPGSDPIWFPNDEWVEKPAVYGGETLDHSVKDLYYEASINYARKFGGHDLSVLGVFNRRNYETKRAGNSLVDFPSYEESWVGRVTYNYNNRYFAEFNGAYTGSEKFAPGKRFGFFPSMAIGWMITEEPFIKKMDFLSFLTKAKVRYSYGEVGSDHGASRFTYLTQYSSGSNATFGDDKAYNDYVLYFESGAANENATWETARKQNLGIELSFFNKLNLVVDFFSEKRDGILMKRENTVPIWFGQTAPYANLGKTKNHGYEIEAEWRDNISDFQYYLKAGFSFQENRVVFRDDPINRLEYQKSAGKPIGYLSRLDQIDINRSWHDVYNTPASIWQNDIRQPGDFIYNDYNGDGVIDDNDKVPMKLTSDPAYTYSFTLGFNYKNFGFRALFYGVAGVEKRTSFLWEFPYDYDMAWPESLERWHWNNVDANRPRLSMKNTAHIRQSSTYGLMDASYFRLKTLELSYDIKAEVLRRFVGINNMQVYVNGNNLFTITSFDNRIDPESGGSGSYPLTRRYNMGFRLTF